MAELNVGVDRLIGRDRELAVIHAFLGAAAANGSTLVLVGEPGIGKTVLLRAGAAMATTSGARVVHCGGMEYESDISYAGLHQLVDPLSDELGRIPPAGRAVLEVALGIGSGPPPDRLSVLSAALALFRQAASSRPLLIVVDDLHWLDRASGAVVGFVSRRVGGGRIGILGATRPGVGGFFERSGLPEFAIGPLDDAEAMELLTRRFVHLPTRLLRRVVVEAEGNPLALLEFAGSTRDRRSHDDSAPSAGSSRQLKVLYEARIERLPEPTRRLLLVAALDGSGDLGVLAAASGPAGLEELAPAERDHLVVIDDDSGALRFRHPILKSVVVERSTHAERSSAHHRLAELFADEPERRGHHLAAAADAPDEDVAAALEEAAQRTLERGDVVGAISKLVRAADLTPDRADRSRRLADTALTGARLAGDLERASELLRIARRRDPTLGETLHAAVATAYVLLNSDGNADTAAHLLLGAIDAALAEPDPDGDGLSEGLYMLALVCHYAGRPQHWASFHDAMRRLPPGMAPEARLVADTFADPAAAPDRALAELDRQIEQLRDIDDARVIMRCSIAGFYTDRLIACREPLGRVVRDGREGGAVRPAMTALAMIAFAELHAGRWDDAQQLAAESTDLCEERGYRLMAWTGRYAKAVIAGNRGDRRTCQEICDAMVEWATPRQLGHLREFADHALAQAALAAGDFEESYRHATAICAPGALGPHTTQALWAALDLIDAAVHTGRLGEARAHAEAMRRADLGRISPRFALVTAAATAMTAPDEDAADLFVEALALPAIEGWPFEVARVRLACGERLRRIRHTRTARTQLAASLDGFERLAAAPWSQRAAAELAATGATRHRPDGGAPPLTPQEREIAMLAATGMTNREIATQLYVSPRTVAAHLYRIFPKLGITSRAALRDALSETTGAGSTS